MKLTLPLLTALTAIIPALSAHADAWNSANDPSVLDAHYEYRFSALPTEASLEVKPWSETYWATAKGSINLRWNQDYPSGFKYDSPSRAEVKSMSKAQLATLSPSEKFDLYLGRYDYPLHESVAGFASPHVTWWKGLCDGWSMSAIQFAEPNPVEVTNPDGVVIPFGSSDVKGLLAYYSQFRSGVEVSYVGGQCRGFGSIFGNAACADINPGALQVLLANQIGLKKKAFVIDRDSGKQIWNQPVFGYKTTVLGSARSNAAQGVLVHTSLYYTDELEESLWTPANGTDKFRSDVMEMDYVLDLDEAGRIVGGSYTKNSEHPDLAWMPKAPIEFKEEFKKLNDLLK